LVLKASPALPGLAFLAYQRKYFIMKLKDLVNINFTYIWFYLTLILSLFYILCATSTIGWRDGPELVVTATYLDVAHPAGFPTYNLLAKILTWLPFGSIGFRVSMFSALAGGFVVFILGLLLKKLHLFDRSAPVCLVWLLSPVVFFALHQGVWAAAVEVEVYSLNAAFMTALFFCAVSWREGRGVAWLYAGGLLYGLACGNHAALALYLPVLLLLTFWGGPSKQNSKLVRYSHLIHLLGLIIFFIIGLSVYILLIVRSQTNLLPVDFGRTNTWLRFWTHISDAKDASYHDSAILNLSQLLFYLKIQFNNITSPLFWLGLPFILWGLKYLWDKFQILSVAIVVLIFINMGFFYYWIDGLAAFLPTVLAGFLLMALGLGQFGRWLARLGWPQWLRTAGALAIFVLGLTLLAPPRWNERDVESGFLATELFWPDLSRLPPESLVLHGSNWFSELALQYVYAVRPDVSLILISGLLDPSFCSPPIPTKFPTLFFPTDKDGQLISPYVKEYYQLFLTSNIMAGKKIYVQFGQEIRPFFGNLKPDLDFMWLAKLELDPYTADNSFLDGDYTKFLENFIILSNKIAYNEDLPLSKKAPAYLFYIMRPVLGYVFFKGNYNLTETVMRQFIDIFSESKGKILVPYDVNINIYAFLTSNLIRQKRFIESNKLAEILIDLDPSKGMSYFMFAVSLEKTGDIDKSFDMLLMAIDREPNNLSFIYSYALHLAKYRSIIESINFLESKLNYFNQTQMINSAGVIEQFKDCLRLDPEELDIERNF
jgi:tetratricopeptide (TPR) repeat protein